MNWMLAGILKVRSDLMAITMSIGVVTIHLGNVRRPESWNKIAAIPRVVTGTLGIAAPGILAGGVVRQSVSRPP